MQESFTRMLSRYGSDLQKPSLLFTIARNAVLDDARKKAHRKEQLGDVEDNAVDPEQQLLIREEYQRVLAAMEQLGNMERDILALTVSRELTYREIARIVGISEANVKVKVHRARVKLGRILRPGERP